MAHRSMPNVIVLIPGIGGSVLARKGKIIWGPSGGSVLRTLSSQAKSFAELALTDDPPDVDSLGDEVTAPQMMPDLHLIPGLWKIDGYGKVVATIKEQFDVIPGENYFEFPYD